jgi:UDP-N-acetylmuramyl pentapeptide synthase
LTHLGIKYDAHQAIADISYIEHRMQVRYNSHTDITILDDAYNANLE